MTVSLETLSDIERQLTMTIPESDIQNEISARIKKLAPKVNIAGFRPGKVPPNVILQRYGSKVRLEAINDLMASTLEKAIQSHNLNLTSQPEINVISDIEQGDFIFSATFEVIPDIQINELNHQEIEIIETHVEEEDVLDLIDQLLKSKKVWKDVERASEKSDKVIIDFKGFINDTPFEGGEASQFEVELGAARMLADFENGLLQRSKGDEFEIDVQFPEDYAKSELAGKVARFMIKVHQVQAGEIPELNDAFAQSFEPNATVDSLKETLVQDIKREGKKQSNHYNRNKVFNLFLEANPLTLSENLINNEIKELKHIMYHNITGNDHSQDEVIPDYPNELFYDEAKRRVHLSLLYFDYVKKHQLQIDNDKLMEMIEELSAAYENPQEAKEMYLTNSKMLDNVKNLLMEELVVEKLLESAKPLLKKLNYRETMNKINNKNVGEAE